MKLDRILLFPYTLTLALRNLLYDRGVFKSYVPPVPSICVGNVTVGGTGKTPMVELLVRMYRDDRRVAVVSRGYGRKTKGYREVAVDDTYREVGDEPLQIKKKFPDVTVVVDADRTRAIEAGGQKAPAGDSGRCVSAQAGQAGLLHPAGQQYQTIA